MLRVMVLDANQRAALAVVRSLGRQGLTVITGDATSKTLAGASRFSSASLVHPDMQENPAKFLAWLDAAILERSVDVLLPVTEISTDLVVRNRHRWASTHIPFAPIELIDSISDKVQLYQLAVDKGVPVPRSVVIETEADLDRAQREIGFPCILKPHRSRILVDGRWQSTAVRRADSAADLRRLLAEDPGLCLWPLLYQAFIPGKGAGIFTLYRQGAPIIWFAHKRLREKPPGGGVSVLSESVAPSEELVAHSRKLLDAIGWEGVAMVEYRIDPAGRPWLMEINARFWGSLQLAIDAGANFPVALLEPGGAKGGALVRPVAGVRLQWLLGDIDRLWLVYKHRKNASGSPRILPELLRLLVALANPCVKQEVFRLMDFRPALQEFREWYRNLQRR